MEVPSEEEVHEKYYALRRQTRPLPGTRPAPLPEVSELLEGAVTGGYVAAPEPLLSTPMVADTAAEAVDARLRAELKEEERRMMVESEQRRQQAFWDSFEDKERQRTSRRKRKKRRKKKTLRIPLPRRFPRGRAVRSWKSGHIHSPCLWQSASLPEEYRNVWLFLGDGFMVTPIVPGSHLFACLARGVLGSTVDTVLCQSTEASENVDVFSALLGPSVDTRPYVSLRDIWRVSLVVFLRPLVSGSRLFDAVRA